MTAKLEVKENTMKQHKHKDIQKPTHFLGNKNATTQMKSVTKIDRLWSPINSHKQNPPFNI